MEDDFPRHRANDASHYYSPARDEGLSPPVANATTRVVKGAAKGTFKLVAFILNLFVPGLWEPYLSDASEPRSSSYCSFRLALC